MKLVIFLVLAFFIYYKAHGYIEHQHQVKIEESSKISGFLPLQPPVGINNDVVTVFMPEHCPSSDAARGRSLIDQMKADGISVETSDRAEFSGGGPYYSQAEVEAAKIAMGPRNEIMTGDIPIVFYKGYAKSNPSYEEIKSLREKLK